HGHQEEVHVEALEETGDQTSRVDPGPDRSYLAALAKPCQYLEPAACIQLRETRNHSSLIPVVTEIEVMDDECVHAVQPEPGEAVLIRPLDSGPLVVEAQVERQAVRPAGIAE